MKQRLVKLRKHVGGSASGGRSGVLRLLAAMALLVCVGYIASSRRVVSSSSWLGSSTTTNTFRNKNSSSTTPVRGLQPPRNDDVFNDVDMDVEPLGDSDSKNADRDSTSNRISSKDLQLAMDDVGLIMDEEKTSVVEPVDDEDTLDEDNRMPARLGSHADALIGPKAVAACNRSSCRLCDDMQVANGVESFTEPHVSQYLRNHFLLSVVTGSFDGFFRTDLALCTWLGHVPSDSLHIFTDRANLSDSRYGSWHEAVLPASVKFSRKQLQAKGYTIDWIRAQYRFVQAFQFMALAADSRRSTSSSSGLGSRLLHWAMVADDDTMINVDALVRLLTAYDIRELVRLGVAPAGLRYNQSTATRIQGLIDEHHQRFRPFYLNDLGWGGGGHILNAAALQRFGNRSDDVCVTQYMVRKAYASDVTFKKCMPAIGIHTINDKALSHCQANFLRSRLKAKHHVTAHIKRDVVMPKRLAMWRVRLYYQVVYHRNTTTAFDWLMRVGACAYGYSCKLTRCGEAHDAEALRLFEELSNNNSFVPLV